MPSFFFQELSGPFAVTLRYSQDFSSLVAGQEQVILEYVTIGKRKFCPAALNQMSKTNGFYTST